MYRERDSLDVSMTLLLAMAGSDGLVVASDSRGTFGDPRIVTAQNDSQKKLYVASNFACILIAGAGELAATILTEALAKVQPGDGASVVLERTRAVVRQRFRDWFPGFAVQPSTTGTQVEPVRPELALLIAGYDPHAKSPPEQKIYQLVSPLDFAPALHNYGFAVVGVGQYALYFLNRLFEPNSTVNQLLPLAAYALTETASQDGKVGGPLQIATIRPGEAQLLSNEGVNAVIGLAQEKAKIFRDSFYNA